MPSTGTKRPMSNVIADVPQTGCEQHVCVTPHLGAPFNAKTR